MRPSFLTPSLFGPVRPTCHCDLPISVAAAATTAELSCRADSYKNRRRGAPRLRRWVQRTAPHRSVDERFSWIRSQYWVGLKREDGEQRQCHRGEVATENGEPSPLAVFLVIYGNPRVIKMSIIKIKVK
ncbi:hypothetical protein HNY73_018024 [Argiope bruennichi]|uniref:Uncharacterized protein n=1 Tax=Argiope bruennichi TaxID=94029 RepID=A0A8T0ECZ4_ARGBR|nr:hypothetical protein HNY73_018024 [Argiope bruennichi]